MKKLLIAGAAVVALGFGSSAYAAATPGFSPFGADLGPGVLITLNSDGSVGVTNTGEGPYDSVEDTYIGVINNTNAAVSTLHVSSASTADGGVFAFDGDGIAGFGAGGNAQDPSGYGGPNAFFTNIVTTSSPFLQSGNVNFITPLAANGGVSFFSLEGPVSAADFTGAGGGITTGNAIPEPATWAMMLVGFFGLGSMLRSRRRTALA